MIEAFRYQFLYQPLFNVLIVIYSSIAGLNMGWAVVILTLMLRVVLLPLSILSELGRKKKKQALTEIAQLQHDHRNDFVLQKEAIRKILKRHKIYPWAKATSLAIQALVFVLLYQVFVSGISGEKVFETLYPFVDYAGRINRMFFGIDLKETHHVALPGLVALFFFATTYIDLKFRRKHVTQGDLAYLIFFPASIFVFLWVLPVVKSLFFFTSILFSFVVNALAALVRKREPEEQSTEQSSASVETQ
jgi:YidC/Oxa1 family membrane protein insertase